MNLPPGESSESLIQRAAQLAQSGRPEEAAALCRRVLAGSPDHPGATHFLGACLLQLGDSSGGFALLERSVQLDPRRVMFRQNRAVMLAQAGEFASAERDVTAAIAVEPRNVMLRKFLGSLRRELGRHAEAADAFRAAMKLAPQDLSITADYGHCLLEAGEIDAALACLRQVTARVPGNAVAHNLVGMALRAKGDLRGAVEGFSRATAADPRFAVAWNNLGLALRQLGDRPGAFEALQRAVQADPDFAPAWQEFARAFESASFRTWDAAVAGDMAAILRHPEVDASGAAGAAGRLLALNPEYETADRDLAAGGAAAYAWLGGDRLASLAHPLFVALIENFFAPSAAFESMLRALRHRMLEAWDLDLLERSPLAVELACALAQQCFLNEYVWPESGAESAIVARLLERARARAEVMDLALLAAYRPLAATTGLVRPAAGIEPFDRLWRRQVDEPAEDARLRGEIARLTPIEDATSLAVGRQYEENPYPRWHRFPASARVPLQTRLELEMLFPRLDVARLDVPESPEILVAGCGSGFHAATAAARNPRSRVLAVDLSLTSLAFAARRCRELGLHNLRFAQADILLLGDLPERFDVIESAGVLHHLKDPVGGWRLLASLLNPGGVMKIALYSEIARRNVVAARALIAGRGLEADLAGIRAARELILAQADDSPARAVTRFSDFFSASGARDLMLHVQEQRFNTSGIERSLAALGLEFLGFEIAAPGAIPAYQARFPDDAAMVSLANWGRFEEENPDTFASMYQFWVLKPRPV